MRLRQNERRIGEREPRTSITRASRDGIGPGGDDRNLDTDSLLTSG